MADPNMEEFARLGAELAELVNTAMEAIRECFQPLMADVVSTWQAIVRVLFEARLVQIGLPAWLAGFIAEHTPYRWIPNRWVFAVDDEEG